jgi:hypothetical protein
VRLRRLNLGQRIVVVVALGAALCVVATYIIARYINGPVWFGYAPLTSAPSTYRPSFGPALVWLVAIAAWGVTSVWILGLPYPPADE